MITNFCSLLAPVTPKEFFTKYYGKQPLHIQGTPEKFASVMSWEKLNTLLNMTAVWQTDSRLQLASDGKVLAPEDYCSTVRREGSSLRTSMPDPERIKALIRQGASIVCNEVDSLLPGLNSVANALEEALEAKVQANLYCSWKGSRAFVSHFDPHEVFALNVEGEKQWRIYEGFVEDPVELPATVISFNNAFHEKAKGEIQMEVTMRPGDLLYLPRGLYHDAIARTSGCIHVTFGAITVTGLDYFAEVLKWSVRDSLFRSNLPKPGDSAYTDHLTMLADHFEEIAASNEMILRFRDFQQHFRSHRGGFDLPRDAIGGDNVAKNPRRWAS